MIATHRCNVCNSKWARHDDGSWSLVWGAKFNGKGGAPGPCCDNVAMGEQIVPWTAPPGPPDPPAPPPGKRVA